MRTLLLISALLVVGFFLVRNQPTSPAKPADSGPPSSSTTPAPAVAPVVVAKPATPAPAEDLAESVYIGHGMPALDSDWDAAALKKVAASLIKIGRDRPPALPGPETNYGRAFFNKLLLTTKRFHLLSPENKVATYNAFTGIFPAFAASRSDGRRRDRELALLTGIEFELIAGFSEDPSFVKDVGAQKVRTIRDLSGNTMIAKAGNIHFIGQTAVIAQDVERRLKMIGDSTTFGTEARVLALSRISQHLPTIISRLGLENIRPVLETNRSAETDLKIRGYYDALLLRIP